MRRIMMAGAAIPLVFAAPAQAQWAVLDAANLAQAINTARNTLAQIEQARRMLDNVSGITDAASIATALNNPELRGALPENVHLIGDDFRQMGELGQRAEQLFNQDRYSSGGNGGQLIAALATLGKRAARDRAVAEQALGYSATRAGGLGDLTARLGTADSEKEVADLGVRASIETAGAVNETNRLLALQMQQEAEQRAAAAEESARRQRDNLIQGGAMSQRLFGSIGE